MESQLINFGTVLDALGGDVELLETTIQISLSYLPQHLDRLALAIKNQVPKEIEFAAHSLKGSLSLYYAKPLVELALQLENQGRLGLIGGSENVFNEILPLYAALVKELEAFSPSYFQARLAK